MAVIYSVTMVTPCPPWKAGFELLPASWHRKVTTMWEMCLLLISLLRHVPLRFVRCPPLAITEDRTWQHHRSVFNEHPIKSPRWWAVGSALVQYHPALTIWVMINWSTDEFGRTFTLKNMNYTIGLRSGFPREKTRYTHLKCGCCHGQHTSPHSAFCLFVWFFCFLLGVFFFFSQRLK